MESPRLYERSTGLQTTNTMSTHSPQNKRPHADVACPPQEAALPSPLQANQANQAKGTSDGGSAGDAAVTSAIVEDKRRIKQRKLVSQQSSRMRTPSTRVHIQPQSFQAHVRMFYSCQDEYEGIEDQLLTNRQRLRRRSDVDLFFRNHVDPQTWWILPSITAEFTPSGKRGDQKVINLLYEARDIWSAYDKPGLTYKDLPNFTNDMMNSMDFKCKWQSIMDSLHGDDDVAGNEDDASDGEMNPTANDDTNKWEQLTSATASAIAVVDPVTPATLPNNEEYVKCRRFAAMLGYYVITRCMRGWKSGKPPPKDSVEYKHNSGNIFFEVPVNITARGPITNNAVLQRLLDALANAQDTAQSQFDCIFQASRMLELQFPTKADKAAALDERCPFKMSEKDGHKREQMVRLCKKVLEIFTVASQQIAASQGVPISATMPTNVTNSQQQQQQQQQHNHHLAPCPVPHVPQASSPPPAVDLLQTAPATVVPLQDQVCVPVIVPAIVSVTPSSTE